MHALNPYWLECRAAELPGELHWLTAWESDHYRQIRFPRRRSDWLLGRWTAKHAVSAYPGFEILQLSLTDIEIRSTPSGAPEVFLAGSPAAVAISLSHRNAMALSVVATPDAEIGCDVEIVEPHSTAFVADFFTPEEISVVEHSASLDAQELAVSLIWSAKESALKATRTGLQVDTRSMLVRFSPAKLHGTDWKKLQVTGVDGRVFDGWWLRTDNLLRTFVASQPSKPPVLLRPVQVASSAG